MNPFFAWLIIFAIIALLFLPFIILYVVINKKQRKYFTLIAEKYNLKKDLGKQKIFRAFPVIGGSVNSFPVYVKATSSKTASYVSGTRANYPITEIGVKLMIKEVTHLKISKLKKINKNIKEIPISEFENYFKVEITHQNIKNIPLIDTAKKIILKYAVLIKFDYIYFQDNYIISSINTELTKEKYYQEAIQRLELQLQIAYLLTAIIGRLNKNN